MQVARRTPIVLSPPLKETLECGVKNCPRWKEISGHVIEKQIYIVLRYMWGLLLNTCLQQRIPFFQVIWYQAEKESKSKLNQFVQKFSFMQHHFPSVTNEWNSHSTRLLREPDTKASESSLYKYYQNQYWIFP